MDVFISIAIGLVIFIVLAGIASVSFGNGQKETNEKKLEISKPPKRVMTYIEPSTIKLTSIEEMRLREQQQKSENEKFHHVEEKPVIVSFQDARLDDRHEDVSLERVVADHMISAAKSFINEPMAINSQAITRKPETSVMTKKIMHWSLPEMEIWITGVVLKIERKVSWREIHGTISRGGKYFNIKKLFMGSMNPDFHVVKRAISEGKEFSFSPGFIKVLAQMFDGFSKQEQIDRRARVVRERVLAGYMASAVKTIARETKAEKPLVMKKPAEKPLVMKKVAEKPLVMSHLRMIFIEEKEWNDIERMNGNLGVNRNKCYVDERGYLRWNSTNRLVHRDVAYNMIYKKSGGRYPLQFSKYDVHHINHDKMDCQPENLQILTRKDHQQEHD